MNLYNTGFQALDLIEGNYNPHAQVSLGEEFMAKLSPLKDQEAELSEFECLMSDITHIITCLYSFSTAIQNPAPKDRLHKTALFDSSYFEGLDIKHVQKMFRPMDPQSSFKIAKYLSERLGKANTKRRLLLKYYRAHNKEIPQYIDDSRIAIERNESSKPVTSTMESGSLRAATNILDLNRAATVDTTTKSQATLPTIKLRLSQANESEQDEDQLSQTSYATSTNHAIRIHIPSPPIDDAAFRGEPFKCPYCCNIIKVRSRQDWKYVCNYVTMFAIFMVC